MTLNVLNVWGGIINIGVGAIILLVFGITFSPLVYRPRISSGSAAGRKEATKKEEHEQYGQEEGGEHVDADGYIDSFAGLVEEGGGSLPLIVTIFTIGLLIWWAVYLVLEWSQVFISVRTLWR
jgi:hypothetical protein